MSTWLLIVVLALGSITMKTLGPVLAGGRTPPAALTRTIALLAPSLITALILVGTVTSGHRLSVDARLAGFTVGAVALWRRAPAVVALVLAAAACALLRAVT